ncbi:MAG: hypothetical protein QXW20_07580 [Ignisphaera sp.]
MSENVSRWTNELMTTIIVIATIGIAVGVSMLIVQQFESIQIGNTSITIPAEFKLSHYSPLIGLLVMMMVIMLVVGVVFGVIIPRLRGAVVKR